MRQHVWILLVVMTLAGCASGSDEVAPEETTQGVQVTSDTGGIRGLVVDPSIVPLTGIKVQALGGGQQLDTTTDDEGLFFFHNLEPGTYIVKASHPRYTESQSSALVEAGVETPPLVRIQLEQLFDADPFLETQKYKGFVGCAYRAGISSTCVNDYTRICTVSPPCCPGGCAPEVTGVVDQREFQSYVGAGWQSIVWEMAWESSLSGTADSMGLTVSFAERTGAAHWYTSAQMGQPFRVQCDLGVICPSQQDGADGESMIAPEGQDNLWNMISAGEGVVVQQTIEVFQTNFHYAEAPSDWSYIAGDPEPF